MASERFGGGKELYQTTDSSSSAMQAIAGDNDLELVDNSNSIPYQFDGKEYSIVETGKERTQKYEARNADGTSISNQQLKEQIEISFKVDQNKEQWRQELDKIVLDEEQQKALEAMVESLRAGDLETLQRVAEGFSNDPKKFLDVFKKLLGATVLEDMRGVHLGFGHDPATGEGPFVVITNDQRLEVYIGRRQQK